MRRLITLAGVVSMILAVIAGIAFWRPWAETPEVLFEQAMLALDKGDFATVETTIEKLQSRQKFDPQGRLLLAGLLVRQGDSRTALKELQTIHNPSAEVSPRFYQFSGEALYQEGDLISALSCMSQLLKLKPESIDAHRWSAAIYYDLGALDLAMVHLNQIVELAPDDYRPHSLKGVIHSDFEQYQLAAEDYKKALALEMPETVRDSTRMDYTDTLLKLNQFREVLDLLAGLKPNTQICLARARAWRGLGERDNFQKELQQAQKFSPDDIEVVKLQAYYHLDIQDLISARKRFLEVIESEPYEVESLYQLALVERQLGNNEAYTQLMERKESSQKLYEEMTDLSQKILHDPAEVECRERLAEICEQIGQKKMAEIWRRAARESREFANRKMNQIDPR